MNFLDQLDEVWRETLESDPETKKRKFNEFLNSLEAQAARLPQGEQEGALQAVIKQMTVYAGLQQHDPEALRVKLGLSAPSASTTDALLAQAAAEPVDLTPQVDAFWREIFGRDRKFVEMKHREFMARMQDQVSHLPKAEQDTLLWQVVTKNNEYIHLAGRDRDALRAKLGLSVASPSSRTAASSPSANAPASSISTDRLAQVAAETVVRATVWESVAALFRAFR
ncbi:hypothetical protein [Bradyrhizobium sp. BR 1433]|uniref:hypothetical protein n=1 Tax=Bradyrhizobium sp. BR 1433 TaxID=3447967 RepID=UPI003EE540CA